MIIRVTRNILTPGSSLKWRTIQGFIVVMINNAYLNGLRLVGNLIMTRLLYPEAFGLMLIVGLVFNALYLLSDAGIHQAIIVHGRDKDRRFLDTAWTLLCIRGALMSVAAGILAWPIAVYYDNPILFYLILVMSISAIIRGFSSPHEAVYAREVKTIHVAVLEASSQTLSLIIAIVWLYFYPTIWALVGYGVMASVLYTGFSYLFFKGPRPRFCLDRSHMSIILNFGKWILISTALTFMGGQGDRFIVSSWLTAADLGLFSIAVGLAKVTESISAALSWKLLLPVYTELRQGSSDQLARQAIRVEALLFLVCGPFILVFAVFGTDIINFLYDDRYLGAGWMLQVTAVGTLFSVYNEALIALIIAHAHSFQATLYQALRVILMVLSLLVGVYLGGTVGLVYGVAVAPALFYLVLLFNMGKYNINPKFELFSISIMLLTIYSIWNMTSWPGFAAPG